MKRVVSFLLTAVLLLSLIPAGAVEFAITAKAASSGYYTYEMTDGAATIIAVDTAISGDVVIPDTLGGYPVTAIAANAFADCTAMTAVTVPASLKLVGTDAFLNCTGLTAVNITDLAAWCGITFESYTANPVGCARSLLLNGEPLTELVIPEGVTDIGYAAFYACGDLVSVVIPEGVKTIGYSAFSECGALESVDIADSVELIDGAAFYECYKLQDVTGGSGVKSLDSACSCRLQLRVVRCFSKLYKIILCFIRSLVYLLKGLRLSDGSLIVAHYQISRL